MLNILLWLGAIEAVGLAAFPVCYYLFPSLRDRGYALSKPLGILIVGYLTWVLSVLHIVPSSQVSALAILAVVGGLSGWYAWGRRREMLAFVARRRVPILASEAIFLAAFFVWTAYRAYDPAIDTTEQPMDFAFLNASIRSFVGSPEDPWLSGQPISYYYFGYWMMGTLTKLTGIVSSYSYNLSLALVPALSASAIFGLVYSMVGAGSRRMRHALAGGIAAALLLTVAANLESGIEFMRANGMGSDGLWNWLGIEGISGQNAALTESWRPQEFMWWWRATRVIGTFQGAEQIDYTIHEFPSFSFILGDLHPHVMSIPFVILFLAACWNLLRSPSPSWWPFVRRDYVGALFLGFLLGGLAFTNMWDLPVFWVLVVAAALVSAYSTPGTDLRRILRSALPLAILVTGVAAVMYLPYFISFFGGQVSGVAPVGAYAADDGAPAVLVTTTRPIHILIVWGLLLAAAVPFLLLAFWRTTVRSDWGVLTLVAVLAGLGPFVIWAFLHLQRGGASADVSGRLAHVLPLALMIGIAVYGTMWFAREGRASRGVTFTLLLAAFGLLLIMGPELLYVDDAFGGSLERMNTVFKLYYQAWIVLAAAAGFAVYYGISLIERTTGWKRLVGGAWAGVFVALALVAGYYPVAAAATKGGPLGGEATLDGLSYLERFAPDEYRAIEFLRENAGRDSTILEAVGNDYTPHGRISSSTGIPTLMGWAGHESQWRGSLDRFASREGDVRTIYSTDSPEEARELLAAYDVEYVYVGARERENYGSGGIAKFSSFMETVFSEGSVTIYRRGQ